MIFAPMSMKRFHINSQAKGTDLVDARLLGQPIFTVISVACHLFYHNCLCVVIYELLVFVEKPNDCSLGLLYLTYLIDTL